MYAPTFCIPFMTCNPAMLVPTPGPGMYVISDYFFKKKNPQYFNRFLLNCLNFFDVSLIFFSIFPKF